MPFTALARWWERRFQWRRRLQAGGRHEKETRFAGRRRLGRGPRRTLSGRWTSPRGGGWGGHEDGVPDHRAPGSRCPRGPSVGSPRGGEQSAGAASPPRWPRGSWALPRRRQPRGSRPCLPPARRSRLPADLPAAGPRVRLRSSTPPPPQRTDCPDRVSRGSLGGPIPGSPLTASQSWVGKGSLARRRLRAGRQEGDDTVWAAENDRVRRWNPRRRRQREPAFPA
ncbi:F-box only protein 17 isoform X3 [Lutra lutra]|uniref:F-box only protein 17 isoform X3 n=1 Tax=Lutra lutra TaxID=9657 RepID=UPI001FD43D9D|nr:F-box only protein 17 isoform X3 [Lutra lutra]